jgi:serine/threonine protein kinase
MSLATGTRLGPYEIIARIGAGGRGEVYGARDTKMKRDVALKVLPDAFASDPERIARFQREAEVLTSLKPSQHRAHSRHPSERAGDGLVEGETLPCPLLVETAYIMTVEDCSIIANPAEVAMRAIAIPLIQDSAIGRHTTSGLEI